MNTSIVIIEDDNEIREFLQIILNGTEGMHVAKAFDSCESGLSYIEISQPDIVLMDIDLPGMTGIEGVKKIRAFNPAQKVLMLSIHSDSEHLFKSLCAGATGYLLKGISPTRLIASIQEAESGGAPMSREIARRVVEHFHPKIQKENLTKRELEILKLLCEGENYRSVATQLFISKNTVKVHIKNIYSKLHVNSRAEMVATAYKRNMLQ